jgi:lysophospholipase L1-like esterase
MFTVVNSKGVRRPPVRTAVSATENLSPGATLTGLARQRLLGGFLAVATFCMATYVVPGLESLAPWRAEEGYIPFWNLFGRPSEEAEMQRQNEQVSALETLAQDAPVLPSREPASATNRPRHLLAYPAYAGHADDSAEVTVGIEMLPALDYFYGQLTLSELKEPGAITRASQWGDSVLGGDGLTDALRKRMQARFGDSGHGFHTLNRYHVGYRHLGVRFEDRGGWDSCFVIFKCRPDGRYGYAGVSTASNGSGRSFWRTTSEGFGSKASRFELWYAKYPTGGGLDVKVDGKVRRVVDTRSAELGDGVEIVQVEDGPHEFEVSALGGGPARGYGVVIERDSPGVVWDECSLIGSFTQRMDYQEASHIAEQVRRRDTDLLVFMLGGNDVQRGDLERSTRAYEEEYLRVIRKFRAGKPQTSCLIMSLTDHGQRIGQSIRTRPNVPRLVAAQRRVAEEEGCAFFNTFEAMGGMNAIERWYRAKPRLAAADFIHPTAAGQAVIATMAYRALMKGYAEFRKERTGKPLPPLDTAPLEPPQDNVQRME